MKRIGLSNFEIEFIFRLMMAGLPVSPSFHSSRQFCFNRHVFGKRGRAHGPMGHQGSRGRTFRRRH
ncbi:MAG: hypothetical protein CMJ39_05165 [Phycisphaerae bacterium]|nr:hypothetical protein [Phycisphaerae bacterium]